MSKTRGWILRSVAVCLSGLCGNTLHAQQGDYEQVELKESGTIVGVVRYEGKVPKPKELKVTTADQPCHKGPIMSEKLVLSADKQVKFAVASIKGIGRGKPFPKPDAQNPVTLNQVGCRFEPHVLTVPLGHPLRILNSDGILHNVHAHTMMNDAFNRAMPPKVKQMDVSFAYPERIKFTCDAHGWMKSYIIVAEHPYYAVTDDDGTFRFENVPLGTHTIEVWHEALGKQKQEVTVAAGEEVTVEFVLERKKRKGKR